MDKPSQTKPYAGLVIYRIQRNVEYLLINDSFTNKKHWFCPKGQVIGNEDEIKCALRETYEATGLRPSELRIEEGFAIELKYLSGTKPKRVKYHLAQLLDNHVRLLPNAEGVHMQWFNQPISSEKVVFKSMQDVFKHAQSFIETKQQKKKLAYEQRQHYNHTTSFNEVKTNSVENNVLKPRQQQQQVLSTPPQQPLPQQQQQQQTSPLYKTRLCERFETEGSCPYGPKCNFAHGIIELRGRETQLQEDRISSTSSPIPVTNTNSMMDSGNQLFKTRLCEKFMKERFCQYGPKCHFAHGENELKERPKKPEEEVKEVRINRRNNNENTNVDTHDHAAEQRTHWRTGNQNDSSRLGNQPSDSYNRSGNDAYSRSSETSWRSNHHHHLDTSRSTRNRSPSSEDEVVHQQQPMPGRSNRDTSWRSTTPILSSSPKTPPPMSVPKTPPPVSAVSLPVVKDDFHQDPVVSAAVDELRRPAFLEHQVSRTPTNKKVSNPPKEKKAMVAPVTTEKSWMKILKLSKEEQDEMEIQSNVTKTKTTCASGKLAQTELIISDLKKFFINHVNTTTITTKGKLMEDVKEVTKIEMRNDLSKKQLLYILLVSLLEDTDASMLTILKSRDHLFKTLVKTNADQVLLLKSWENFVNQRKPIMVNKTAAALSHWYDCEMIEEEAFMQWYNVLEKDSPLERKSAKFIEWLNTSDDEEED